MKITELLFICIVLLLKFNSEINAQSDIVSGLKTGFEIKEFLFTESGTYRKEVGISFGYFRKFKLNQYPKSTFLLNVELGFNSIIKYKANQKEPGADQQSPDWNGSNYVLVDEKFYFGVLELTATPAFNFDLCNHCSMEIYFGPFIGFGSKSADYKYLDSNVFSYPFAYDFGTEWIHMPYGLNSGISFLYHRFIIDLRYKYSELHSEDYKIDQNDVFLLVGIGF